ncbi:MAG: FAD-binding protein [Candidatus Poribacteria bacterium]|nr:FAD-binding protein [Candidatus Poribacteria bacterium]
MNQHDLKHPHKELYDLLGTRFSRDSTVRDAHARDASYHRGALPDAVVYPKTNAEIAEIVKICAKYNIPIIPYGTGTGVEGAVVAFEGTLCIALNEMNCILRVSPDDRDATVQAGVTRLQLNTHLADLGTRLHFSVDPGADASLGGMAATRASGTSAVRYGTMLDNVLGLTVVTVDGSIVRTGGRARKSAAGYDLTRLFIGSEGTLGIITEITLKLTRLPESVAAAVCAFPSVDAAVDTVIKLMDTGANIARIELLDERQMDAVNKYAGLDYEVAPTLFFEFHGSAYTVAESSEIAGKIAAAHGSGDFRWATDESERKRLWQARYDSYYAALNRRPGSVGYVTDVCVPISQLAACIAKTKTLLAKSSLVPSILGHVGDGNFHVVFPLEPDNKDELAEAQYLSHQIVDIALEMDGTCTGEHGVGVGKRNALEKEHGEAVDLMRAIKHALDPLNLMNPGKVFL